MQQSKQLTAIVTGASSGIGLGITLALLESGWNVAGTSRKISSSKELRASSKLVLIDGDSGQADTAKKVVAATLAQFGQIDLLVNNAGIFIPKPFVEYTDDDYSRVMTTNVSSTFYMTREVVPHMKARKSGHVINISASLADQPSAALPALLAILSKSPLSAMSKALALEFAADQIRFNTVSPGIIDTPLVAGADKEQLAKFHPLGRLGRISEIVDAVLYLQNATFVTGENIRVDGGFHAGR